MTEAKIIINPKVWYSHNIQLKKNDISRSKSTWDLDNSYGWLVGWLGFMVYQPLLVI